MNPLQHSLTLLLELQGKNFVPSPALLALPVRVYRSGICVSVNGNPTDIGRLLNLSERFDK